MNADGGGFCNLSDDDFVSHCCWRDDREILSYLNKKESGKGYYLLRDQDAFCRRMWNELVFDGHPTYSPDGSRVVTDTYPDRRRNQSIYVATSDKVERIAKVYSPFKFSGDVRCDLHPRWSRDGKQICFDASFEGKRALYVVEAAERAATDVSCGV